MDSGEVLRYLGCRDDSPDQRLLALIQELSDELKANTAPKNVYGIWDVRVESPEVSLSGLTVKSESLSRHLAGCDKAALLAVTLGTGADTLIRRYSVRDMEKAVVAQAICTAMIESYCDEVRGELAKRDEVVGLFQRAQFSPGYGDFAIAHQEDIIRLLNCDRRIGLTITDGYMLVPSKSITAIIGFAKQESREENRGKDRNENCAVKKCDNCDNKKCEFRR